jgi:hypothetical protein
MEALKLLFGTDIGLLSVFTIGFATVFVIYVYSFAKKKMDEDAKSAGGK